MWCRWNLYRHSVPELLILHSVQNAFPNFLILETKSVLLGVDRYYDLANPPCCTMYLANPQCILKLWNPAAEIKRVSGSLLVTSITLCRGVLYHLKATTIFSSSQKRRFT